MRQLLEVCEAELKPAGKDRQHALGRFARSFAQHAEQAANLVSALTEALDRLWDRPHDTRVATLRLLDCLSDLDDRSLCMLCGSIVQYVEARYESVV